MAAGTQVGTGFVRIAPDFTGFQEKVGKKLAETLGPAMDRAGANANKRLSKSLADNRSLRSSFQPLLKRFQKFGDTAGEEIAGRIGRGAKPAQGDMFGLAGAIKEVGRRSKTTSTISKALEHDTFGVARAAVDAGKGYQIARSGLRDWGHEAHAVDAVGKRLSKGVTSLARDVLQVGRNLKASAGGFGGFEGIMARANRGFQFFRNILGSLKFPALAAGVALAAQSLSALAAGAVATASALAPLSGALVALPAAALAGAQAFGALKLAMMGIGSAVKAAVTAQVRGGEQATQTLRTQENAAEAVADAHQTLSSAERDAKFAEEDLTKARKEATRQLQEMERAAEESHLTEREGALALREARRELNKTLREPGASGLEIQAAEQAVERAKFGLEGTREDAKKARQDYAEAQKKGVEGMPEVVAAKRSLADSNRAVAAAERGVAKAVRENSDAMKQQGSAATALQQKMAELTPTGRKFARFLISLKPQFDSLREVAAKGLFPGVEKGLKSTLGNLGVVKKIVGETSGALGKLAAKAGAKLGSRAWGRDLGKIGAMNTRILTRAGDAALNLGDAFRNILVSAEPLLEWMSKSTLKLSEWVKTSSQAGRETGSLGHFFEETREAMERVWRIVKPLGEGLLNVGKAAKPLGNEILDSLGKAAEGWAKWTGSIEGKNKLKNYFVEVKPAIFAIGRLVRDATDDFAELGRQKGVATLVETIRKTLLPLLTKASGVITGFVSGFLNRFDRLRKEGVPTFDAFIQTLAEHAGEGAVKIAGALVRGFLNASPLGKLAIGGWLLSRFGGLPAILTTGKYLGTKLGIGVGEGAGGPAAGSLASGLGKAIGPAIAAVGLANIITSATQGDWKDAGFEAGGALAGGIAGAFAGGPLGAAAGAGIGAILGEALSGLFHSEKKLTPIQKALRESSDHLARSLHRQRESAELTVGAQEGLRESERKVHRTTAELRNAEKNLVDARKSHSSGSLQVLQREAEVREKRQGTKKATNELRFAEEELAFAKKAQGRSISQVVHDASLAIVADKKWIGRIKERIAVEGWSKQATEAAQKASKKLAEDEGTRSQALAQARHRNVEWAESLEGMTTAQHRFGAFGKALVTQIENLKGKIKQLRDQGAEDGGPLTPLNRSLEESRHELRTSESRLLNLLSHTGPKLKDWALRGGGHVERLGGAFESLSGTVGESLESIMANMGGMLKKLGAANIPKFTVKYLHRHAPGSGHKYLNMLPEMATGGLASVVPGNSTGDRHVLSLNGTPIAKVESREGIFVGNRKMMAATKAANDAVPRFQGGGLVGKVQQLRRGGLAEPKLEGNDGALKHLGRAAIHKVFEGAKEFVAKAKPKVTGAVGAIDLKGISGSVARQAAEIAKRAHSPFRATLALFEALWAESSMGSASPGNVLQALEPFTKIRSAAEEIAGFLTGHPTWTGTAAIPLARSTALPANAIAQLVQKSGVGEGNEGRANYLVQKARALATMRELGVDAPRLAGGGLLKLARGGSFDPAGRKSKFAPLLRRAAGPVRGTAARAVAWARNNLGTQEGSAKQERWGPDPWCGYFFGADMSAQGVPLPPNPGATSSWEKEWGNGSDPIGGLGKAQPGDFLGFNGEHTALYEGGGRMISGNWGNEVAEDAVSAESEPLTSVRRPHYPGGSGAAAGAKGHEPAAKPAEQVPPTYKGAKTGRINFGPIPNTLKAVNAELKRWEPEAKVYRKAKQAASKNGKPETAQAIGENLTLIEARIRGLQQRRTALRFKEVKKHLSKRLSKAFGKLGGYELMIEGSQRDYEGAAQYAEQVVGLEPQSPELPESATDAQREAAEKAYATEYASYIEGKERPAYARVLDRVADWRNKILGAEIVGFGKGNPSVAAMQTAWEKETREADSGIDQIRTFAKKVIERKDDWVHRYEHNHKGNHPKESEFPDWLKKQLQERKEDLEQKLPILTLKDSRLRQAIQEAREKFFPGGQNRLAPDDKGVPAAALPGSGSLEEQLVTVQGIHPFPEQHSQLGPGEIGPPNSAGRFGGVIWDLNASVEELGLKIRQATNGIAAGGSGDNSELVGLLREIAERERIGRLVTESLASTALGFDADKLPKFHQGGVMPGPPAQEGLAVLRGLERIRTPEQELELAEGIQGIGEGDLTALQVQAIIHGDIVSDRPDPIELVFEHPRFGREVRRVTGNRPTAGGSRLR
jgi:chaperonin cofactor prefoldin